MENYQSGRRRPSDKWKNEVTSSQTSTKRFNCKLSVVNRIWFRCLYINIKFKDCQVATASARAVWYSPWKFTSTCVITSRPRNVMLLMQWLKQHMWAYRKCVCISSAGVSKCPPRNLPTIVRWPGWLCQSYEHWIHVGVIFSTLRL